MVGLECSKDPQEADRRLLLEKWKEDPFLKQFTAEIDACLQEPGPGGRRIGDFLALRYFDVYARLFGNSPPAGFEALRKEMDGKYPSVGYFIFAQLVGRFSNPIITVNFDNFIADALFLTGNQLPRVLDHENVAHLAKPNDRVTLICKIHRDLLKNPKNTKEEMKKLADQWRGSLQEIFKYHSPIFIGYGGNDHTLMGLLEEVESFEGEKPIWLHYTQNIGKEKVIREEVSEPIARFLDKHQGVLVPYSGFDSLMHLTSVELSFPDVVETFSERVQDIRKKLERKLNELSEETAETSKSDPVAAETLKVVKEKASKSILDWIIFAESETNYTKRIAIYDEAIEEHSESKEGRFTWLYNNRGYAKDELKHYKEALVDYDKAIELDPKYATAYCNRGLTKLNLKHYEEALVDYDKAIELDPKNGNAYYNKSCFYALQNQLGDSLFFLKKSLDLDAKYLQMAQNDSDFDSIRDTPEFKEFIARHSKS